MIIPTAAVVTSFLDFLIGFLILISLMLWYQFLPDWKILTLPLFVLMVFLASLGPGLYIASLNVKFRDFRHIIPFTLQLGLYISPVGFSSAMVSEKWHLIYSINPMVSVIDGFRWAVMGNHSKISIPGQCISWSVVFFFLWLGLRYFRKMEKEFADVI